MWQIGVIFFHEKSFVQVEIIFLLKHEVVRALLTFHKPGPFSLIRYVFIGR